MSDLHPQADPPPASPEPGGSGLPSNTAGALSYFLGAITGILFLVIEKRDPFVRFHAAQSIAVTVVAVAISILLMILNTILGIVPILGWILGVLLSLGYAMVAFGFWLFLMYQAWQGRSWEVPFVGAKARELLLGGARVS